MKKEMKDVFDSIDAEKDLIIRKKKNEIMIIDKAEYEGKDIVFIESIENCDIFLPFIIKTLYIKNVYHSRVHVGFVKGASYVQTTNKSTYLLTTFQARILKANTSTFLLNVKQSPLIEDCQKLKFGPCKFTYPEMADDELISGFDELKDVNKWDQVKQTKQTDPQSKLVAWSPMTEEEIAYLTPTDFALIGQ